MLESHLNLSLPMPDAYDYAGEQLILNSLRTEESPLQNEVKEAQIDASTPVDTGEDGTDKEDQVNTSADAANIMNALKLDSSPEKSLTSKQLERVLKPGDAEEEEEEEEEEDIIDVSDSSTDDSRDQSEEIEEFPLFPERINGSNIIEDERILSTPEKRKAEESPEELENSICKRTRSQSSQFDTLSPMAQKMVEHSQIPSKIPVLMSMATNEVLRRRSKRLQDIDVDSHRLKCQPKQVDVPLRPALKSEYGRAHDCEPGSANVNLVVDCKSGLLTEATRYATALNSVNGDLGVELPKRSDELVQIAMLGARKSTKNAKVALVRGYTVKGGSRDKKGSTIGFYSQEQYKKYCDSPSKVIKPYDGDSNDDVDASTAVPSRRGKKGVRWASELEW
ncbi:uncharacterized protein CYBJADRAFT_168694 [Cyberlindnera jadinii NRRL Y-1542]|uniref:Uncharacterized protein n=1 Tax=Cyberlindnera jadinii (strain ATCC 18201 / CBS 1600 / BCRC 20928 / JCM 3617 / NBRC 0987 / NRRL Y-1542) TaxID=983966 RepID=A0A1E4RYM8_CYBJN|nr:hypothetical protein CYBJADRAFT_168694 [Cyberlindnera jadinii NRRL Y-1542]ODV72392.1 hypothetical protein CYBJADRAFT_168694 [Cyberlindnera jadinii NRRL Y-1542]